MTPERWQKIEEIYHSALERDASLRADYLLQACAGDDPLRLEVESLLAQDTRAQFLESPAGGRRASSWPISGAHPRLSGSN